MRRRLSAICSISTKGAAVTYRPTRRLEALAMGRSYKVRILGAAAGLFIVAGCEPAQFVPPTVTPPPATGLSALAPTGTPVQGLAEPNNGLIAPLATLVPILEPSPTATPVPSPTPTAVPTPTATAIPTPTATVVVDMPIVPSTFICSSANPGGTFKDVVVAAGGRCDLSGSVVEGNIDVMDGAELILAGASVQGNIRGEGFHRVLIGGSTVGGIIDLTRGTGFAAVQGSIVLGNVGMGGNAIAIVRETRVQGNVAISGNRHMQVYKTEIGGNLECQGNSEKIEPMGDNVVGGEAKGQCSLK